jgi:hypothetical protein
MVQSAPAEARIDHAKAFKIMKTQSSIISQSIPVASQTVSAPAAIAGGGGSEVIMSGGGGSGGTFDTTNEVLVDRTAPRDFGTGTPSNLGNMLSNQGPGVTRRTNIRFNPHTATSSSSFERVEADVSGRIVGESVSVNDGGAGAGMTDNRNIEATPIGGGAPPVADNDDLMGIIQKEANARAHIIHASHQFSVDLLQSGFSSQQLEDPGLMNATYQVYSQDPSVMPVAAVVAKSMGADGMNMKTISTVQKMVGAGWNVNRIQRPDIVTAVADYNQNGDNSYPSPQYIEAVRYHPNFTPGLSNSVPVEVVKEFSSNQSPDGYNRATGKYIGYRGGRYKRRDEEDDASGWM